MTYYGIYKITNLLNGKMYIGQHTTSNIDDGYMGSGKIILRALKKYGKENFRKEWLMFCEDEEELNYMERVYVDQTWVDRSDTYNLNLGGIGGIKFGQHCKPHSEEHKRKISEACKGKPHEACRGRPLSDEHRRKLSEAHKGIKRSDETRRKISEKKKGIKRSDEQKKKQSEAIKLWWSKRKQVVK